MEFLPLPVDESPSEPPLGELSCQQENNILEREPLPGLPWGKGGL
jgi:hypothetical protein